MQATVSKHKVSPARLVKAVFACILTFAMIVFPLLFSSVSAAVADEGQEGPWVQVLYDFYSSSTNDKKDVTDILRLDAAQELDGDFITVKVCDYPGQYGTLEDFMVMIDFAAVADAAAGVEQRDITAECSFDTESCAVSIPAAYAQEDLSVIFFVPDNKPAALALQVFSADNPQVGERFAIYNANIQPCEDYNQNAHHCFAMDEHYPHYGFAVSILSCENPDVEQAGAQGNGGTIYGSSGDSYDYNWAADYKWVWADCAEAGVSNTGGECAFNDGYVEVRSIDAASSTVDYYFFMNVDGENGDPFQNVAGYFSVQSPGGYIQLQKSSADASVTAHNPCYSLADAVYTIYDSEGTALEQLITDANGLTNKSGLLPVGSYTCKETTAPDGFVLDSQVYSVTVSGEVWDETSTVHVTTNPEQFKTGTDPEGLSLSINKVDAETDAQKAQGSASLEGTELLLKHYPVNPAQVKSLADLERMESDYTWTLVTDEKGRAAVMPWTSDDGKQVTGIPLGVCTLEETKAPQGYLINSELQLIAIKDSGTVQYIPLTKLPKSSDDIIRGDLELTKVAADTQERLAEVPFKITSKTTGESHIIVTDANGYASTKASWNLHSYETNAGTPTSGIWFGEASPDDSKGALLFDSYIIEELPCDANEDKELIPAFEITLSRNDQCIDLGTLENESLTVIKKPDPTPTPDPDPTPTPTPEPTPTPTPVSTSATIPAPTSSSTITQLPKTADSPVNWAVFGGTILVALMSVLLSRRFSSK